jgi:sec-independent protein translocase protein TatA
MFRFGFWELLIIVFVVLLIFGPKRLPQMGRSMGSTIRGFKDSVTNRMDQQDAEHEQEQVAKPQQQPQLPPAQPPVAAQQPQVDPRERDTVV